MDPNLPNQPLTPPPPPPQFTPPAPSYPQSPPLAPGPSGKGVVFRALVGFVGFIILLFILWKVFMHFFAGTPEKVTLTYWGLWEDEATMNKIFADFERAHPNITIQYTRQDPTQYRERLLTRMNNGTGPDIFRFHNSWVPMLSSALLPLPQDVLPGSDLTNNYYPAVSNDLVRNGAILGLPVGIDTMSLFTNTEIFQAAGIEVPTSWDDFVKAARQLTVKDETGRIKTAGAAMGTYDNVDHAPDILSLLFMQNGVPIYRISTAPDKAAEALDFYTAFAKNGDNVWDDSLDPSTLAFAKGNLAMYFGYSWDIFTIKGLNPSLQFQTHPVPALPGRTMTIASYWVEGVSRKTKHPKEAFLLMQYLAQKDTLEKLYAEEAKTRLFGELYPRMDMADSLTSNDLLAPFVTQAKTAVSTPFVSGTKDSGINAELNGYLGNAVRAVDGQTSSQTAVKTLIQGEDQVLSRYGF